MPNDFETHRALFATSLAAVSQSLRTCADVAETFAALVNGAPFSPEMAQALKDASDLHIDATKGKRKAALSPDDTEGGRKRKRLVKPKDPNAPKRPASSYIMYQNEVRKGIKEQYPDISNAELMVMISEQWKAMSDEQKSVYNDAMKTAKEHYSQEKLAYENRSPEEIEAANAATAAAVVEKKKAKPRRSKASPATTPVVAPLSADVCQSSEFSSSDDEQSEGEEIHHDKESDPASDSSEEEQVVAPKKGRKNSAPIPSVKKMRKNKA